MPATEAKVVLITGASSEIGQACARLLRATKAVLPSKTFEKLVMSYHGLTRG